MKTVILHFVSVLCVSLLLWQVTDAQEQLPTLKVVGVKEISPVEIVGISRTTEITFIVSNNTTMDVTLFGRTVFGEFDPTGDMWTVNRNTMEVEYHGIDEKLIFKKGLLAFKERKVLRPGESFTFRTYDNLQQDCRFVWRRGLWVQVGKSKRRQISSDPIPPGCE